MSNPTDIRNQFLDFFKARKHVVLPSAPLIPANDPTLLFTNAGMNQFKDVFLEQGSRAYKRVVNSQKCIRVSGKHNDLEEVGASHSHHTFFEMLGNWSFGDYYKVEAIGWAWELLTKVWGLDGNRLYATVFKGDDAVPFDEEAYNAWLSETGILEERISLHDRRDNFWEMGEVGPCGPCSEIHYDFGPAFCSRKDEAGHRCAVNGDCGRVVELWNLVFIQFRRDEKGRLHPLPRRHVDTGAGFERILKALEGVASNYETSIFAPLVAYIAHLSGVDYHRDKRGIPHRVAADHIRMIAFSIADGALPSNEGRGYVLRRVIRRAARFGREIGLEAPFLYKLVEPLTTVMGGAYLELKERSGHIIGVVKAEEEGFARTLGKGLELFGGIVEKIQVHGTKTIGGDDAFRLYDTYGFPLDLTELMARERGLRVDREGFDDLMHIQREQARGVKKFAAAADDYASGLKSEFVGYENMEVEAKVLAVHPVNDAADIVLDRTPFYAEAGGQVSDHGWIECKGNKLEVIAVSRAGEVVSHRIDLNSKQSGAADLLKPGVRVRAVIDWQFRLPTQHNHTATHLLHTALRILLGRHANQAGSLVAPDRLRFDFTHFEKVDGQQIGRIEQMVNDAIRADYEVRWYEKTYKEAIDSGIVALFGEKYGDVVRIVHIGSDENPYSRELCGGCHVRRTGEIGLFRIVSESAVSAGVRRIEAVTGQAALNFTQSESDSLQKIRDLLGSHGSDPVEKLRKTLEEKKALEKEFERLLDIWAANEADHLLENATDVHDVHIVQKHYGRTSIDRLKLVGDAIRSKQPSSAALLVSIGGNGAGQLVCVVGDAAVKSRGLKAGELIGSAAKLAGGGGGGRPHMATAGTKTPEKLNVAILEFADIVASVLNESSTID